MTEFIQTLLLGWAYGPPSRSPIRDLLRMLARALLDAETDRALQIGSYKPSIATDEPSLPSRPRHQPVSDRFRPLNLPVVTGVVQMAAIPPPVVRTVSTPVEKPHDPDIDAWLLEVTEPYILWDAPKPNFAFSTDYFYDYADPLPQPHMSSYVRPIEAIRRPTENLREDAFSNLSNDRKLFTLPPETVLFRNARLRISHELG